MGNALGVAVGEDLVAGVRVVLGDGLGWVTGGDLGMVLGDRLGIVAGEDWGAVAGDGLGIVALGDGLGVAAGEEVGIVALGEGLGAAAGEDLGAAESLRRWRGACALRWLSDSHIEAASPASSSRLPRTTESTVREKFSSASSAWHVCEGGKRGGEGRKWRGDG